MTPHSATRKTRSQSPPQLTQRRPVSQMQAAMPSSNITPYMCSVSGPRLNVPFDGDGIEPRTTPVTGTHCARIARRPSRSTEDADRELGRAAPLDELDRLVEIDVQAGGERDGVVAREAHAHELGCPPALYAVEFGLDYFVCRSIHPQCPVLNFRASTGNGSPPPG